VLAIIYQSYVNHSRNIQDNHIKAHALLYISTFFDTSILDTLFETLEELQKVESFLTEETRSCMVQFARMSTECLQFVENTLSNFPFQRPMFLRHKGWQEVLKGELAQASSTLAEGMRCARELHMAWEEQAITLVQEKLKNSTAKPQREYHIPVSSSTSTTIDA